MRPASIRVESDLQRDAGRALEMLHVQLISTLIDPYWWKWVLICLHHTVETFLIACERQGAEAEPPVSIGDFDSCTGEGRSAAEAGGARILELARRARNAGYLPPPEDLDRDLATLAEYRDALLQRNPSRWNMCVNPLPRISRACLQVVDRLAWSPGVLRWQSQGLSDRARVKYLASLQILDALEEQYRRQSSHTL